MERQIYRLQHLHGKCFNSYSLLIAQLYAMDTYIQILRLRFLELDVQWSEFDED